MSDKSNISNDDDVGDMQETTFSSQSSSPDLSQFSQVFSRLAPQDIEQFQLLYQHWAIQQQINDVQQQLAAVQRQLAETVDQVERAHPSALALATLARLQASGVEDIDLLDRMLERGEEWLDHTIQHLEYCEQLDVIRGDYEEWCRHALEDAFAWLDSMQRETPTPSIAVQIPAQPPPALPANGEAPADETTEELFLQKLMSEESANGGADTGNGDEKSEESSSNIPAEAPTDVTNSAPVLEETTLKVAAVQSTGEEQDNADDKTISENNSPGTQEETAGRRSNFVQRFLSALWP